MLQKSYCLSCWMVALLQQRISVFLYNTRQSGCCLIRQTTTFHSANRFTGMLIISMGGRKILTANHPKKNALQVYTITKQPWFIRLQQQQHSWIMGVFIMCQQMPAARFGNTALYPRRSVHRQIGTG